VSIEEATAEVDRVVEAALVLFGIEVSIVGPRQNGKFEALEVVLKGEDGSELHAFLTPHPKLPGLRMQLRDHMLEVAYRSHHRRHMPDHIQQALDDLAKREGS
jgi:hypothetical protein